MLKALSWNDVTEKIYAGFIGKAIGVRLGAPVEPTIWSYERIRDTYGEISNYVRDFKNFAADDDTNGPIYFIRAIHDYGLKPTPEQVGKTWVNYAAEGHGMYWWGGFGISTEHTAYLNLLAGIPAPKSGSIEQNGKTVAEQIGGQIFIDSWGWVYPGQPKAAATAAAIAASVAHDGEGLNGARWVAAAIAQAFVAKNIGEVIEAAMSVLEQDSLYAQVANAVINYYQKHPTDWRGCRAMLENEWGYDRYPGICHMIPNAGVLVMSVIYGEGSLNRTVEIATMAGWDTDCNAGNAGAIVGTLEGLQSEWNKYRTPINDIIIASGVTGSLNIVDIPTFAKELTVLARELNGEQVDLQEKAILTRKGIEFDFSLPGATHGFRTEGLNQITLKSSTEKRSPSNHGSLEIQLDRLERGQGGKIFWKPFYRRHDFDDERYRPMFSPLVAEGQTVRFKMQLDAWNGDGNLRIAPYIRRTPSETITELGAWEVPISNDWQQYEFTIPHTDACEAIDEIGILVEYFGRLKFLGRLFLTDFTVSGEGKTRIDANNTSNEWGALSRFTWNRGHWTKENGYLHGHAFKDADIWTGHYFARDQKVTAKIKPLAGRSHLITTRAQGTSRYYAAGFHEGEFIILKEDFGTTVLASIPFEPNPNETYEISLTVQGTQLTAQINQQNSLSATDDSFAYGMSGYRLGAVGRVALYEFFIEELS